MYDRILVPTDGGTATREAAKHAIDVAGKYDATVHALYVVGTDRLERAGSSRDELEAEGREATEAIAERAGDEGVEFVTAIEEGRPSDRIFEYVDDNDVDLVVMGTHGRTGVGRVLLGSVAERVIRRSEVPVMAVRATGERTVGTADGAITVAREALATEGHDDVSVTEEPYRAANTWIVRAENDEEAFNVHVDPSTGETSVARIRNRD
ncbi:universal stress protein [Halomicrococcus gelatinilyticus]|uniref:universal stress protein n=1 Tax=Halomicrococcus gelatinilyticus TaxID=1702103 RepID=UPI002E0E5D94